MQCRITIVSSLTSTSLTTRGTIRCCSTTSSVSAVARKRVERRQSLRQAQMGGTITGLLDQRAQFLAQRLLALAQQRHALA